VPFKDVVAAHGHRRLAALLARSVRRDALPPSLIFSGSAGSGMRDMATALAQSLNCLSPVDRDDDKDEGAGRDACGVCTACSRIARGVHPDVVAVVPDDKGRVNVEHIRDVIDRVGFRPFEGRRRVVIIDEADTMLAPAQSALLKVLEEPPPSSVFVLVATRPDMLLPTVHSRCPRLRFEAVGTGTVDADVRDAACSVLMHVSATDEPGRRIEAARDLLPSKPATGRLEREHVASHLRAMASILRDVEILATRANAAAIANVEIRPVLDRLMKSFGGDRGIRAFAAVDRALEALDRNAGVKIVADWLVLQL
jgi:DNA polymerase-3 subunit delta'